MVKLLVKWIMSAVALYLVAMYIPGIHVPSFQVALIAALALGLLNALVKPVLWLLTLPINLITLGLFSFVLNGAMFLLATKFVEGFTVDSLFWGIVGAFLVSLVTAIGSKIILLGEDK